MDRNLFSAINIVNTLSMCCVVGGILVCGYYKDSPQIVSIASLIALAAWMVDRGMAYKYRSTFSKLTVAEATDLSFLRQIRRLLKDGNPVSEEHIAVSESASEVADSEYERVYGFGRPMPAVAVKHHQRIGQ
jgi:hypothetical protein